jgi:hypothetical protein
MVTDDAPIQLGWRDLEVLAALTTLEAAAPPHRVTGAILARAVGRDGAAVRGVLDHLVRSGVLAVVPPTRPGGPVGYRIDQLAEHRLGVTRLGDLLLLAAVLLAGNPAHGPASARDRG